MDSKKSVLAVAVSKQFGHFLMSLDEESRKWINSNMVLGRVFSFYGKFGVVQEDLGDPYDLITKRFIAVAQGLLNESPPFYFDIETHFSGVDIIRLELNKKYELNIQAKMEGKSGSNSDLYSAEEASVLVSMLAYYFCLKFSTTERFETGMRKYRECLADLEQSQHQRAIIPGKFFYFK